MAKIRVHKRKKGDKGKLKITVTLKRKVPKRRIKRRNVA